MFKQEDEIVEREPVTLDSIESVICFRLRGQRTDGKCPCDDRGSDQKYCCLELAEDVWKHINQED